MINTSDVLPLFFKNPLVINKDTHKNFLFKPEVDYNYAKSANVVPLTAVEFEQASISYPIVFSNNDDPTPFAVTGSRKDENLFVKENGEWEPEAYIPAYVRKYPFVFLESIDKETYSLCIEESSIDDSEDALPIFSDGDPSEYVNNALTFCQNFQASWAGTVQLTELLQEHDLLIEQRADIESAFGEKLSMDGFLIIDREKFNSQFRDKPSDFPLEVLFPIFSHFTSLVCWKNILALTNLTKSKDAVEN
jgi:hypothetical protein